MIGSQRYSLVSIIGEDLIEHSKLPLLLLVLSIASAIAVVYVTYSTRLLTEQREQLILERDKLNVEWRNLILEEYVLGEHSRVAEIAAQRLQMNYVELGQEQIVLNNK